MKNYNFTRLTDNYRNSICLFVTAGEEDEEWSKNVTGEDEGHKDEKSPSEEKPASPETQNSSKDNNEVADEISNGEYQSDEEQDRQTPPASDRTRTNSGSEPRSPDVPKVRLNTNLATDPARNTPSVKSVSPSRSPTGSVRSNSEGKGSVKTERIVSPNTSILPSPAELEYLASLPPALQSGNHQYTHSM